MTVRFGERARSLEKIIYPHHHKDQCTQNQGSGKHFVAISYTGNELPGITAHSGNPFPPVYDKSARAFILQVLRNLSTRSSAQRQTSETLAAQSEKGKKPIHTVYCVYFTHNVRSSNIITTPSSLRNPRTVSVMMGLVMIMIIMLTPFRPPPFFPSSSVEDTNTK